MPRFRTMRLHFSSARFTALMSSARANNFLGRGPQIWKITLNSPPGHVQQLRVEDLFGGSHGIGKSGRQDVEGQSQNEHAPNHPVLPVKLLGCHSLGAGDDLGNIRQERWDGAQWAGRLPR